MHNAYVLDTIKTVELTRPFAFLIYDRSNNEISERFPVPDCIPP